MASTTNAAVIFGILVILQVSCAISRHPEEGKFELQQNVPAVMTENGFQQGEGGGGPAACDGQYHSDNEYVVTLSSEWYAGGARCGRKIRIVDSSHLGMDAKVVDECAGCDNEVGVSPHIWKNFNPDTSQGEVNIRWSDLDV